MPTTTHETSIINEEITINTIIRNQQEVPNTNTIGRHHTPEDHPARSLPPIERNAIVPLIPENGGPPLAVGLPAVDHDTVHQMPVPSLKHVGTSLAVGYGAAGRGTANHGAISHVPVNQPPIQPLPTIQVTIGRVEVRATPPLPTPLAPSRQAPAALVKSLDDYLRQREEGRFR